MATQAKRQYASGTTVGIGRTKDEVQTELVRMGAGKRLLYEDDEAHTAIVSFERAGIQYRVTLPLADAGAERFRWRQVNQHSTGRVLRTLGGSREAWLQDCAERWRALAAYIKALRVAAEAEITTVERVLQPFAVVPGTGGRTVTEWTEERLPQAYRLGTMPPLLALPEATNAAKGEAGE